ncbi:hypothetical protein MERGE_003092 [Pneumocystis wakefieldiae]|uniref:Uncharacterized protein n=1 Tax=Pneumocystis wakefieldiae TaxID=38082 RepID=A0A899G038_9ASCO|nr:hypothetical protein MERGE_003092 [Pneumocystis wakefieldiae]
MQSVPRKYHGWSFFGEKSANFHKIPPCDKDPRYRLNIHCKYDETGEDQSKLSPLPSWVSCFPAKNLERVHFFMAQIFLLITSFISVSFILWRRYIRHE